MNISRQKLIEELEMLYRTPVEDDETLEWNRAVYKAIEYVESQPPADQWIPCSERLPEKAGWYWVTEDKPYSGVTPLACFNAETGRFSRPFSYSEVVAWIPSNMPEPYKGVE